MKFEEFISYRDCDLWQVEDEKKQAFFRRKLLSLMKKNHDLLLGYFTKLESRGRMLVDLSVSPLL